MYQILRQTVPLNETLEDTTNIYTIKTLSKRNQTPATIPDLNLGNYKFKTPKKDTELINR